MRHYSSRRILLLVSVLSAVGLFLGARSAASWRPVKRKLSASPILAFSWTKPEALRYVTSDGHVNDVSTSSLTIQATRDLRLKWDVASFSSDGSTVIGGNETQTSLWRLSPLKRRWIYSSRFVDSKFAPVPEQILAFALTAHGDEWVYARATSHFGSVTLLEERDGHIQRGVKSPHGDVADALAFSDDGHYVAYSGGLIGVWNRQTQKELWDSGTWSPEKFAKSPFVTRLLFSPDNQTLVAPFDSGETWLFRANTGVPIRQLDGNTPAASLAFSPDGSLLAGSDEQGSLFIWDVASGRQIKNVPNVASKHSALAFSHGSSRLAVGTSQGEIQLWRIR